MKIEQLLTIITILVCLTCTNGRTHNLRSAAKLSRHRYPVLGLQKYKKTQNDAEHRMPYKFSYVVDDNNGNMFQHFAKSDGDLVMGEYEVLLPDGRIQTVRYTADSKNGYNAEVSYRDSMGSSNGGDSVTQSCGDGLFGSNCNPDSTFDVTKPEQEDY